MRLLVVEDDVRLCDVLRRGLGEQGHVVDVAHDGEQGEAWAQGVPYDAVILDVRTPSEYLGLRRTAGRNGHVPGAVNIDWQDNLSAGNDDIPRLLDDRELHLMYESAGVTPDKLVLVHCQTGVRSSETFMVLKELGYPRVANYVAGWQEWGNRTDTPVESA